METRIIPACAGSIEWPLPWALKTAGSSPHARGPSVTCQRKDSSERIIPACAGSIGIHHFFQFHCQDHPRMRGVHTKKSPKKRHS